MKNGGIVYIITNSKRNVLYIGVTNNIQRRMHEHKTELNKGFAQKCKCKYLLYYEAFWDIRDAIQREKVLKKWNRSWKLELIQTINPALKDLSEEWFNEDLSLKEERLPLSRESPPINQPFQINKNP